MMNLLAHVTVTEVPTGALLFLAGIAVGALAMAIYRHTQAS